MTKQNIPASTVVKPAFHIKITQTFILRVNFTSFSIHNKTKLKQDIINHGTSKHVKVTFSS